MVNVLELVMLPEDYVEIVPGDGANRCRIPVAPAISSTHKTEENRLVLSLGQSLMKNLAVYFHYNHRQFGICDSAN